ncbi:hypothetical protein OHB26_13825 [Nocardia sp. NBC_01503]|uniref:hypothetical protein n=1 Tax=Nocardia sp. NBC_01503 TaxID=2975997 RepID=UPI002E7B34B4|nr:hypothetical protein [Nocardia sp. NBC_01503]WTL35175.1 hypothetical protein OHB26_13825 [Nocardia sp. NBC_01503]
MTKTASDWLIAGNGAHEAAFRIDEPGPHHGQWVLSYLPGQRLTREQAYAGVALAELIIGGFDCPVTKFEQEMASMHAEVLGMELVDIMLRLALRDPETRRREQARWISIRGRRSGSCGARR